ncbi:MAG: tRNA 5-methoxyuridine(34)/uridine 5-oxyacetic acid(34) synthase CmoB [Proteobacteria bacterium]|nr:tRNA 5-methoxyuridine(34)/uridine 5-oxyacetic acid(34) synthase CmoB [Pseudomonadota bacterium]MBU1685833.1 tRNA 5-methoxyuridine(34)/uridine 5-oxyacetic acid(34) synthase CmoB [Pseudomonadota bacterium]
MRRYLTELPTADRSRLKQLLQDHDDLLSSAKKGVLRYREPFEKSRSIQANSLDLTNDVVTIGRDDEITPDQKALLLETLRAYMPWRKGPFNVFGIEIDAEWRSERKWNRLLPVLPELTGKKIADVGCNNGYYMFRMAAQKPELILGFEPHLLYHYTFQTLNSLAGLSNLETELLGVENLGLFEGYFDVIFLMGVLYHRISPIEVLKETWKALRPGGSLIVESQAIPGDDPVALFPTETYGKVPGTYFVPTGTCLANWLIRSGFDDVSIFCSHPMSNQEQRQTDWMSFESYDDFMAPNNPDQTIEGYPAPWRVFLKAVKR